MNATAAPVAVPSGRQVSGRLRPPPSKSISNRYFNLALLSGGRTEIGHPLESEDLDLFRAALVEMGFEVSPTGSGVLVDGRGARPARATLDCGNSGTMFRFLTGALAAVPGDWTLTGRPRLFERPVGALVDALRELGAGIDCLEREGFAPMRIEGGSLRGGTAALDASESSQFLSALLMAATRGREPVEIRIVSLSSTPYLDLTLDALALFGARVDRVAEDRLVVQPSALAAERLEVESDASAATYPAAAALLTAGRVSLEGLTPDSRQGDRRFLELLERVGARVEWRGSTAEVSGRPARAVAVDLADMPDQVPTLAAIAPFLEGETRITGVPHLRIKESDRLAVMARELTRVGATVRELDDGLVVEGSWAHTTPPSTPVEVQPEDDHRIAMSLALVGLRRPGVAVCDPGVVAKSYPHFWRDLATLVG